MQQFKTRHMWEIIDLMMKLQDCQVSGIDYIPTKNSVGLGRDMHMHLAFETELNRDIDNDFFALLPEFSLEFDGYTIKVPHGHAVFDCDLTMEYGRKQNLDISINKMEYGVIDDCKMYYWRYVYPLDNDDWFLKIAAGRYQDDQGTYYAFNYLPVNLEGNEMHLYMSKRKDERYMVIQSADMITGDEMFRRVLSITTALGLVVGRKYGDYRFCMVSSDKEFETIEAAYWGTLDKTKTCNYRIVNPKWVDAYDMMRYPYQQYAKDMMAKSVTDPNLYYDDDPVALNAFNGLVNLCYKDNDMYVAASMLLEGTVLNIMYQMPFFHVVLETITSSLMKDEGLKTPPPMPNDEFKVKVLPSLLTALSEINNIPAEVKTIYCSRLTNNLNSGANNDKLTILFDRYGYELTKYDREAIKKRNSVFHGHLTNPEKPLTDQEWQVFAISLRLHKLCSILLLKAAGFNGRILNNEVIYGVKEACERKEPPYITI